MKKLVIMLAVAALFLALVACGSETATTQTPQTTTSPTTTTSIPTAITTVPTVETTCPVLTTKAPVTAQPPRPSAPVEAEIQALKETAWWNQVHRMNPLQREKNADGSISYIWSLTLKAESGLFPVLSEDHETHPETPTLQLTTAEGAFVYIKDLNKDTDYTKYQVANWKTARWCDIWFEAVGFVPEEDGEYDVFLFFVMPEYSAHPGEYVYAWGVGEGSICGNFVMFGDPAIDAEMLASYGCSLCGRNEKYDVTHTATQPENFPTNTFNFTINPEDGLFPTPESFQEIKPESAYAYVMGLYDTAFTRYDCDYMLTESNCDMWFTLKDFTPEPNEEYTIVFFFMSGASATHPNLPHYVYGNGWIAGAHE